MREAADAGARQRYFQHIFFPKSNGGEWERVLFVPTGALMSTVSYNEGASVPGIAHAIVLEHEA